MTNKTKTITNPKSCRVAYTCGGRQPVICTHIGDSPNFYMYYEGEEISDH